jgi:hypothetical protein
MSKVKMSQISNCALYGILEGTGEEINEFIQTHRQHDNVHLTFSVIAFDEQIKGYRAYFKPDDSDSSKWKIGVSYGN